MADKHTRYELRVTVTVIRLGDGQQIAEERTSLTADVNTLEQLTSVEGYGAMLGEFASTVLSAAHYRLGGAPDAD